MARYSTANRLSRRSAYHLARTESNGIQTPAAKPVPAFSCPTNGRVSSTVALIRCLEARTTGALLRSIGGRSGAPDRPLLSRRCRWWRRRPRVTNS